MLLRFEYSISSLAFESVAFPRICLYYGISSVETISRSVVTPPTFPGKIT